MKERKLMRRISMWASTFNCAIVLIGHLSKRESSRELYRGLGSIDVVAAARSVLQVERDPEDKDIRIVRQIKNSLGPNGEDIHFEIRPRTGFHWLNTSGRVSDSIVQPEPEILSGQTHPESIVDLTPMNKYELAAALITKALADGPVESMEIKKLMAEHRIADKTAYDKNWKGFSVEDYRTACESVEVSEEEVTVTGRQLNMGGYQLVRSEYFPSLERPYMTITNGKIRFNTACLKKFEDVEYVELLLNTVKNCIAIRPCDKENPNAIHWGRLREERWVASTLSCRGLSRTLFDLMNWEDEGQYKFSGQYRENGDDKLLLFELEEPVLIKTVEQVVVPEEPEEERQQEEIVIREKVRVYPPSWTDSFGRKVCATVFVQRHYAGEWDVLRPATELEEMNIFTAVQLDQLMAEAETIMEGWAKTA